MRLHISTIEQFFITVVLLINKFDFAFFTCWRSIDNVTFAVCVDCAEVVIRKIISYIILGINSTIGRTRKIHKTKAAGKIDIC